jgi:hypothetical protein
MRRLSEGMGRRLAFLVLAALLVPGLVPGGTSAEDVEVSTTFLTFFKNGGGYIEYSISGSAASDLRSMIDDPAVMFPFETRMADGDGTVDQAEGEAYMRNLDDILTRREIVLRGVKMENVDVDEHRGLIGSSVNDTRELYLHITFRGGIQYDQMEFNVSGLEPLATLYGSYEDIPSTLTVDERMFIVAAGMGAYETSTKEEGTLFNLRAPMAAVVSYHASYTASSPPSARMEYDHNTMVGNPLVLMLFMFLVSVLTLKLPKALARENDKERVSQLHLAILIVLILFWVFYALGGNAYLVWFLGIALTVGAYVMAYMVYARDWRGMAVDSQGTDLGEAISAVDPVNGHAPPAGPVAQGPALLGDGGSGVDPHPTDDVLVVMPGVNEEGPGRSTVTATATAPPPRPQVRAVVPVHSVAPPTSTPTVPPTPSPSTAPPGTKTMRCRCGGTFRVPLEPRPLEVQCPNCGVTGTLKS